MRFSSLSKLAVLAFSVGMGLSSHAFADASPQPQPSPIHPIRHWRV